MRFNTALEDQSKILELCTNLEQWASSEIDFVEKNPDIVQKISEQEKSDEQSVKERLTLSQKIMNRNRKFRENELDEEKPLKSFELFIENLTQEIGIAKNTSESSDAIEQIIPEIPQTPDKYDALVNNFILLAKKDEELITMANEKMHFQ